MCSLAARNLSLLHRCRIRQQQQRRLLLRYPILPNRLSSTRPVLSPTLRPISSCHRFKALSTPFLSSGANSQLLSCSTERTGEHFAEGNSGSCNDLRLNLIRVVYKYSQSAPTISMVQLLWPRLKGMNFQFCSPRSIRASLSSTAYSICLATDSRRHQYS